MTRAAKALHVIGIVFLACVLGCSSESGAPASGTDGGAEAAASGSTSVVGTVTLPADATGRCAMVALDNDTTGSNGSARRGDGSYLLSYQRVSGRSVSFSFDGAPPGTYFLWAYVDVDSSVSAPSGDCEIMGGPSTGDHLGYYDTGLSPPSSPNVAVPHAAGLTHDFAIGVFP